ncbi:MAG: outer membrane protein assembly factor BamD [Akkermansia sp.]|nr:outer membrane protein assembly factor BamD [Akkermansia sp.]
MRMNLHLLLCAAAVLPLTMCQQYNNGLLPAGSLQAADPQADALLSEAKAFVAAGELSKAKSKLKDIALNHAYAPCAPEARLLLGDVYEKQGLPRDAFNEYEKVVTRYQNSPLYTKALDRQLAMAMAAAEGELQVSVLGLWKAELESSAVEQWLASVITNAPYNDMAATATSILARYRLRKERYEEAALTFAELVEKYPDSRYAPEAQLMVAQIWAASRTRGDQNMANLARAQEAYEEFSLRFPGHADAGKALTEASNVRRLLIQQELETGRYYLDRAREYDSAIFCLENVIRQKSINPEAAREAETLLQKARTHKANANRKS